MDSAVDTQENGLGRQTDDRVSVLPSDPNDISQTAALRWLGFILALATVLRSMGLTYQLPVPSGPDHLGIIGVALRMGTGDPNPHMFTWPAAPFYFMALCYGIMFVACRASGVVSSSAEFQQWFTDDPSAFFLVARLIMVAVGLSSVALIYRIGCQLGSRRRGLWAAVLLAVTPIEVLFCHYQKAEPLLVLSILVAFSAMIRWWHRDSTWTAATTGAAIGLACAVKYNAALLVVPAAAVWVHHMRTAKAGQRWGSPVKRPLLVVICLACVFFVLNPYLLLDIREALHQLIGQKHFMQGGDSPIHQAPVRSYLAVVFPAAFGYVLYLIYGIGLLWLTIHSVRRWDVGVVLLLFVLAYAATMMSRRLLVTPYYPLPMVPALALGAAAVFAQVARWSRWISAALGLLLTSPTVNSLELAYRLALPSPAFRAEYWIRDNIPRGDRVAHRHWLPPHLPIDRQRLGVYPWPMESRVRRDHIDAFIKQGVRWFVLQQRDVTGREDTLFGPSSNPLACMVERFSEKDAYDLLLPTVSIGIWKVTRPAEVPPLVTISDDPNAVQPRQPVNAVFEGGVVLLGFDPPDTTCVLPGVTLEWPTYWVLPAGSSGPLLVTGDLSGTGGYLAGLTQQLAYGTAGFVHRSSDRPCAVIHRILVRPGYRAKPGDYAVRVGLRDPAAEKDLSILKGPHAGHRLCELGRITVRR